MWLMNSRPDKTQIYFLPLTTQVLANTPSFIYQAQERCTERESDHPPAARPMSAPSSADHLHPVVASRFRRPLDRLQRTLQPPLGVLPFVKQGVFFLVLVVVVVLHAGETNVLLFTNGVSCGGRRHTCQSVTTTAADNGALSARGGG